MRPLSTASVLFATLAVGCGGGDPLPAVSDIKAMKATVFARWAEKRHEFAVPQQHWQEILDSLRPASRDYEPLTWQHPADLEITTADGHVVSVQLYELQEPPGAFSIRVDERHKPYYRGGDSERLRKALKAAHEASKKTD